MALTVDERTSLWRGRIATSLLFLLYGLVLGSWTARIPAVKQALHLSDGQLSIGLLAFAGGAITGMQLIGRFVDRYGASRIMIPAALADGALLLAPGLATGLVTLAVSLFAFGAVHGSLNIAMNANSLEVQRSWGKPIVSSFHAVYSVGGFAGATIGGLFAAAELSPFVTFVAVAVAVAGLAAWAWTWAQRSVPAGRPQQTVRTRTRMPGVLFLGVLAFCALVGEGAAADWSTVYLHDSLGSTPGFAAAAYASFSIMMMAGRVVGDRLVARFGAVAVVRASGALAATGLAIALLIGQPVAGVVGFGCLGAGLAGIAPQVFSAAGNQNPAVAGRALARVATLGFLGFVVGPVVIGGAAELAGLPVALAIPVVLALFVAATASALRPRLPIPAQRTS